MGERTGRYALIIDHGKITYAAHEESPGDVSVRGLSPAVHGRLKVLTDGVLAP